MRVPLATVSRRVSDLEKRLGTQLLVRTSRQLELTEAGRAYSIAAREILAAIDDAERTAAGEFAAPRGDITLTAPIVFGRLHVLPIVIAFLNAYPDINANLLLSDKVINFTEDHVDVALRVGDLPDSAMIATRVGSIKSVVCASPAYLRARGPTPGHPSELKKHACIAFEGLTSSTYWTFGEGRGRISIPIRARLVVNTAEAAVDAAIAGLGITKVLSYQVEEALRQRKLTKILAEFEPKPTPVSLVYPSRGALALKTRAFIEFATSRLRARLATPKDGGS